MKTKFLLIVLLSALLSPLLLWGFEEYDCDADKNLRINNDGLIHAAIHGHAGAISCIIDSDSPDVQIDGQDQAGRTPLFWAAFNGQDDAVRMLILK